MVKGRTWDRTLKIQLMLVVSGVLLGLIGCGAVSTPTFAPTPTSESHMVPGEAIGLVQAYLADKSYVWVIGDRKRTIRCWYSSYADAKWRATYIPKDHAWRVTAPHLGQNIEDTTYAGGKRGAFGPYWVRCSLDADLCSDADV